ncbi:hypothetical protein HDG32_005538 [Paraburkholderia sp. CI2]|uniref:hypothetical protein n=1 Tax=Paraburkholderia sp. CI2 TaxID=2723093 RepID=UPI00160E2609|nr:hypothetical protein [Paraburkholderia sp. CI2]MBB5469391.1 hypothetical protein [Paraburkholderia sp. CI2]
MSKPSKAGVSYSTSSTAESGQAAATEFARNEAEGARTHMQRHFVDDSMRRSQALIAELLHTSKQNISFYAKNVLAESDLLAAATAKDHLTVQTEGPRQVRRKVQFNNLDLILTKKGTHNAA